MPQGRLAQVPDTHPLQTHAMHTLVSFSTFIESFLLAGTARSAIRFSLWPLYGCDLTWGPDPDSRFVLLLTQWEILGKSLPCLGPQSCELTHPAPSSVLWLYVMSKSDEQYVWGLEDVAQTHWWMVQGGRSVLFHFLIFIILYFGCARS